MLFFFLWQIRDLELEVDEEKRRHAESVKILRKKERSLKELVIQSEEDHANVQLLQEALDKTTQKVNMYKRQLQEQVYTVRILRERRPHLSVNPSTVNIYLGIIN